MGLALPSTSPSRRKARTHLDVFHQAMLNVIMVPIYQCTLQWQGSKRGQRCLTIPSHPSQPPHWDPPWTNAGMGFNLTMNVTVECDNSITVWYCWNCATCEGSNPCSRKFAMNTRTLCERTLSLSTTTPPKKCKNSWTQSANSYSKPDFPCHLQAASALTFINKQTFFPELKLRR